MADELQFRGDSTGLTAATEVAIRALERYARQQRALISISKDHSKIERARAQVMVKASQEIISNNERLMAHANKTAQVARANADREIANQRRLMSLSDERVAKTRSNNSVLVAGQNRLNALHKRHQAVAESAARRSEARSRKAIALSKERQAAMHHEINLLRQQQAIPLAKINLDRTRELSAAHALVATERRKLEILKQQNREKNRLLRQQDQMVGQSKQLLISWQSIGRILAIRVGYQAFTAFVNQIREGVRNAHEFQRAVAGVQTISQRAGLTTNEWADGLQRVSDGWRLDIIEQAEAAYQALTNQVVHGREAFEFLESANRFATAALTETNQAVRLAASVMNAYGLSISHTEEIYRSFFKTIELGRLRAGDLTEIGRVLLPGAQLGIEYQEVAAAMATLTRQGAKSTEAMTFLRGIFQRLIRPTEKMKEFFTELGVESGEAAIATFGYIGFLEKLEARFKGSSEEIGEMFSRIRAIIGIFGQQGSALQDLKRDYDEITNAQGEYNKAVDIMLKPAAEQFAIASSRIRNIMTRTGSDVLDSISGMTNGFQDLVPVMREAIRMFKYGLAPAAGIAATAILYLGKTLMMTPAGKVILGITAIVTAYSYLRGSAERAAESIQASMRVGEEAVRERMRQEADLLQRQESRAARQRKEEARALRQSLANQMSAASQILNHQTRVTEAATESIIQLGDTARSVVQENIRSLEQDIRSANTAVESAIRGILSLQADRDQTIFSWDLEEKRGQEALDFIGRRMAALTRQADQAAKYGELGILDDLQNQVRQLSQQQRQIYQRTVQENERARQQQQNLEKRNQEAQVQYLQERQALQQKISDADNDRERVTATQELRRLDQDRAASIAESRNSYAAIEILQLRTVDHEEELIKLYDHQISQRQKLANVMAESAEAQKAALLEQQFLQVQLEQVISGIRGFKVADVLALGEPRLVKAELKAQEQRIKTLAKLAEEAGIVAPTEMMEKEFRQQSLLIEAHQMQENIRLQQESLELQSKQAEEARKAAADRRDELEGYFRLLAIQTGGLRQAAGEYASSTARRAALADNILGGGHAAQQDAARLRRLARLAERLQDALPDQDDLEKGILSPDALRDFIIGVKALDVATMEGRTPEALKTLLAEARETLKAFAQMQDDEGNYVSANVLSTELLEIKEAILAVDNQRQEIMETLGEGNSKEATILDTLKKSTDDLRETSEEFNSTLEKRIELLNQLENMTGATVTRPTEGTPNNNTQSSTSVGKVEVHVQAGPSGKVDPRQIVEAVRTATRQGMLA